MNDPLVGTVSEKRVKLSFQHLGNCFFSSKFPKILFPDVRFDQVIQTPKISVYYLPVHGSFPFYVCKGKPGVTIFLYDLTTAATNLAMVRDLSLSSPE